MNPVGPNFSARTGVAAALGWLQLATAPGHSLPPMALATAARRPPRALSPRVVEWIAEQRSTREIRRLARRLSQPRDQQKVTGFANDLEMLRALAKKGATTQRLLRAVGDEVGLADSLDKRLDASRRVISRSSHTDDLRALESVALHCEDPREFEGWLAGQLERPHQQVRYDIERESRHKVCLSTIHRVKGLQWPHVIVLGANNELMPHRRASDIGEERRIFHVALTRCSNTVLVVTGGPASPFIGETRTRAPKPPEITSQRKQSPASSQPTSVTATTKASSDKIDPETEPLAAYAEKQLKEWRLERCREDKVPAFVVMNNATLNAIARTLPTCDSELLAVDGIGPVRLASYGDDLKKLIAEVKRDGSEGRDMSQAHRTQPINGAPHDGELDIFDPADPIDATQEPVAAFAKERLEAWRGRRSRADGVRPHMVLSNATLRAIARVLPASHEELLAVHGFPRHKLAAYARDILKLIAEVERSGRRP